MLDVQPQGRLHHHVLLLQMGISAPQGCGKTTLVEQLQELFAATGRCAASVSIDDFYLTYKVCQASTLSRLCHRGN
jgi:D-glycerate 3-kinase